jgi:hypothetical protein
MGDDAEAAETADVLGYRCRFPTQPVRRTPHSNRYVVPGVAADFDAVEAEHPAQVDWRLGLARAVAMVREDHEPKAGTGRRRRDVGPAAGAIGLVAVNVKGARKGAGAKIRVGCLSDWKGRRRDGQP